MTTRAIACVALLVAAAGILLTALLFARQLGQTEQTRAIAATNVDLRATAVGQCQRVQDERERTNALEAIVFYTLTQAARGSGAAMGRRVYRRLARAASYSPPSDCGDAVDRPLVYELPKPVKFQELGLKYAEQVIYAADHGLPEPEAP